MSLGLAACGDDSKPAADDTADTLQPDTQVPEDTASDTGGNDTGESPADTRTPDDTAADTRDTNGADANDTDDATGPATLAIAKGDRCSALTPIDAPALPYEDSADTTGLTDDYIYTTGTACGGVGDATWGDASPDMVYQFTPALTGTYVINVTPVGSHDPAIMLSSACPPLGVDDFAGLGCLGVADEVTDGKPETLRADLRAGRTYYVLVDAWNNDTPVAGAYSLSIAVGEDCDDGVDNNGDAAIDCADAQCGDAASCDESTYANGCGNGSDDDRDGKSDCADPDCGGRPACDEATYAGGCGNDADDDGDGVTDCADADCEFVEACNEATYTNGCDNSTDDDGDGKTDCQDVNCSGIGNCDEASYPSGCSNGTDDEGDGRVDCEDPDCGTDSSCLGPAETCEEAIVIALGEVVSGTTEGRVNDYTTSAESCLMASSATTSYGGATPDAAYRFTAPATALYEFVLTGDFDNALTVTTDCSFATGSCFGAEVGVSEGERIVVKLSANETVFVIVDGWSNSSASNAGDFQLVVKRAVATEVETNCEDQVDQDNDGDIDCADVDCAFALSACTETGKCTDTVDNDADGETDCDDSECRVDPVACPAPAGDNCGTPVVVTAGVAATFDTCDFAPDFSLTGADCSAGSENAPDMVAEFTAPSAGTYYFDLNNAGTFDSVLNVVKATACPNNTFSCDVGANDFGELDSGSLQLGAGERAYIIVAGYGDIDWGDPDCGAVTLSVTLGDSENCTDDVDNDRDGDVDCYDADCASEAVCNESQNGANACADSSDNDADGFVDCLDIDCVGVGTCPDSLPGDNCASPLPVSSESVDQVIDTCSFTNDFTATETSNCDATTSSGHTAQDFVIQFTAPSAGEYIAKFDTNVDGSSFDAVLNVVRAASCPSTPLSSCAEGSDVGPVESVRVAANAGEVFWFIVDGYSSACSRGAFSIRKLGPEICDDDIDNNENGDVDCEDVGCDSNVLCNESLNGVNACGNGTDEDGDALVDCFDPNCATFCPGGLPGENCSDAIEIGASNFEVALDTCAYANDFNNGSGSAGCRGSTFSPSAPDAVAKFVAPTSGDYRFAFDTNLDGSSFDAVLNVVKSASCPGATLTSCVIGSDAGAIESGRVTAVAGDVFWVIVDGYSSGCSLGRLTVTALGAEVCDDGIDNDGDDDTDCEDADCRASQPVLCPAPAGENCGSPNTLALSVTSSVDTCAFATDFTSATTGGCITMSGAPDMVFQFTAVDAGTYRFKVNADWIDFETAINFVRGATCPALALTACAASGESSSGTPNQQKDLTMAAGETMWMVLGSNYSATECGAASVTVTRL